MDTLHSAVNQWIVKTNNIGKGLANPVAAQIVDKLTTNLDDIVNSTDLARIMKDERMKKINDCIVNRFGEGAISSIGIDLGYIGVTDSYDPQELRKNISNYIYESIFL